MQRGEACKSKREGMRFCTNAERKKRGTVGWEGEALLIMVRVVLVVVVIKERKPALLRLLPEGLLSLLNSGHRGKGPRLGKVAALTGDAALLGLRYPEERDRKRPNERQVGGCLAARLARQDSAEAAGRGKFGAVRGEGESLQHTCNTLIATLLHRTAHLTATHRSAQRHSEPVQHLRHPNCHSFTTQR